MIMDICQEGRVNKHSLTKVLGTIFFDVSSSGGSLALWAAEDRVLTWLLQGLHLTPDLLSQWPDHWARTWARSGQ